MLAIDEATRGGTDKTCECCGNASRRTWSSITRDGVPYAVFFASCYDHGDVRESWIDVIFGTWGTPEPVDDHLTFGCRFGPVQGSDQPAATAVDAAAVAPDAPLFGQKLTRAEALAHPRLAEFWAVIDHVVAEDPLVHPHHYHGE
ncbi:hypothetical protein [Paractinoplanes durhamensis]|uniref:Uncharacterized protein n=1 Tax=Paractinoplanes durhamensis TaxID=113563 RepID=A0ABQ3YXE1_9ACTN|nr:hypothetical protein [Actinoplanes durhamensis]GIE02261.1 hypothetical protein Adu01nite_36110 [Actinoplanes durhamensis]